MTHFDTIRAALDWAENGYELTVGAIVALKEARSALTQIEDAVRRSEPVGWWNGKETVWLEHELNGYPPPADATIPVYTAAPVAQQYEAGDMASAAAQGFRDGVARVAQQEPVASIYISASGEREMDDWRHDLPQGRNELYAAPVAQQHAPEADCGNIDWKAQYEHQKRRAERWIAKYEADIGPLEKAGPAAQQPQAEAVIDKCSECGKTSTKDSMWALYCVECIENKIAPALAADQPPAATVQQRAEGGVEAHLHHYLPIGTKLFAAPQQAEALPDVVRDAERYRFIRDADRSHGLENELTLYAMESLDEYVDAAMEDEARNKAQGAKT